MKSFIALVLLVLAIVACNSCVPSPSPAPAPSPKPAPIPTVVVDAAPPPADLDAAPAPTPDIDPGVRDACAALAKAGCVEGGPLCAPVMQRVLTSGLTAIPLACLVGARTKADVHACGRFVPCI